jgi:ABC-type Mn2+/Zn2+ transport system ATPase subunit
MTEPAFVLRTRKLRAARGVTVASDVALSASAGEVIAVEGPNGAGKSTLLAAAAGLLPAANATVRPATVGYSPERASVLPRLPVSRWLVDLARTAGLSRADSAARADDVLRRLGLDSAAGRSLHALSRGNTQRALVAQALIGDPGLLILDEPTGGLDDDGVRRVVAEIERAADRQAVVLVARHPAAPLPLPAGPTWRFQDGTVSAVPRESMPRDSMMPGDGAGATRIMLVETEDGQTRRVPADVLPAVLRAALDAGLNIRRVEPVPGTATSAGAVAPTALDSPVPRRAGTLARVLHGAVHRARLLAVSQWFFAPLLIFLVVLATIYATDAGPPLQPAAVTAIALIPVMAWLGVLSHRVDGRELARAFAAHIGGRAKAHLAADVGVVPYAVVLTALAIIWPLVGQSEHHPRDLVFRMIELHLAAALFGIGFGSVLALIERTGYRLVVAVAAFLGLVVLHHTPMTPLLKLSTAAATNATPVASQVGWLCLSGVLLVAAASLAATRIS